MTRPATIADLKSRNIHLKHRQCGGRCSYGHHGYVLPFQLYVGCSACLGWHWVDNFKYDAEVDALFVIDDSTFSPSELKPVPLPPPVLALVEKDNRRYLSLVSPSEAVGLERCSISEGA